MEGSWHQEQWKTKKEQQRATKSNEKKQKATKNNKKQKVTSEQEKPKWAMKGTKSPNRNQALSVRSIMLQIGLILTALLFPLLGQSQESTILKSVWN